jgi:hypothetical protein
MWHSAVAALLGRAALVVVVVVGATAGCGSAEGTTDATPSPIVGGAPESGHPEVGQLEFVGAFCTGTLIADRFVLTAALRAQCAAVAFRLGSELATDDARSRAPTYRAAAVTTPLGGDSGRCAAYGDLDVAIVRLETPVAGVTPAVLGPGPNAGDMLGSVGFGEHDEAGVTTVGNKRSATEHVLSTGLATFVTEGVTGATSQGDSGGPIFANGRVVGVTSCGTGFRDNWYTSVSYMASWIDDVLSGRVPTDENPRVTTSAEVMSTAAQCDRFLRVASGFATERGVRLDDNTLRSRCTAEVQRCAPVQSAWVNCTTNRVRGGRDTEACASRMICGS